ncbi:hypothetical protein EDB81DRAFT_752416 [Dactylonectria macrodidyma]|uniref:NmrA-like domain-containing protein n=1 Tax=Dactylonectria macrodidyma TaxID=307937 RepID=A0A9P9FVQ3_9HYPO|nr:hypothetical protein EDB81DRAFT_752416 [Dactylonectria macrodidyma]
MSNLLVVIGATGGQGGGVVDAFLKEPGWKVRGTTRNVSLAAKGVNVVPANLNDQESLEKAFQDATAIFAFSDYYETFFELGDEKSMELEFEQGKRVALAAAKNKALQRLVLSAAPHTSKITEGEVVCPHVEGKGRIVTYITNEMPDLAAKTTFAVFTIFANNALLYDIFKPIYVPSAKKYVTLYPAPPDTPYPSVGNPAVNGGIFVRRLVKNPPPQGSLNYIGLWGPMAQKQLSQWQFFHWVNENYPPNWEGIMLLEGMDLLTVEDKRELLSVEESLKCYDWSAFEKKPTAGAVTTRFSN